MSLKDFNRTDDIFSLCGLNCGLCGYRLKGRCSGCFKDSFCAKICPMAPCSVEHGNIQYCFECPEYPCRHYEGFDSYDTLVLHRNQRKDMQKAKEIGIDAYHNEQREKKKILDQLLKAYDDGSKADFFCLAVNMLELKDLTEMLETADERTSGLSKREKAAFITEKIDALGSAVHRPCDRSGRLQRRIPGGHNTPGPKDKKIRRGERTEQRG